MEKSKAVQQNKPRCWEQWGQGWGAGGKLVGGVGEMARELAN